MHRQKQRKVPESKEDTDLDTTAGKDGRKQTKKVYLNSKETVLWAIVQSGSQDIQ